MVELTLYQLISITVGGLGMIAAVLWYITNLRNMIRTRRAQLFMDLYNTFRNREFQKQYVEMVFIHEWQDYDDWTKKYGSLENIDKFSSYVSVPAYFEGVGVLVKRDLIDLDLVKDIMASQTLVLWEKIEPLVKESRVRLKRPQLWEWFEYLYNEIKKIEE